ncbi:FG-GAP-like repeat-containing protein [Lentzea sp. JNUCC 0626]|uniref:FG-GAP-like repeat-containing protein n=1 Tax=Lentzea sp. JNUCC 0626 TaxID=3367513 RepID=UPI003747EAA1
MKRTLRTALLVAVSALVAGLFTTPAHAAVDAPITRAEVLKRSQSWIDARVPYNQGAEYTNQYGRYRQDCSGYVSMAWGLGRSRSTYDLPEIMDTIPRDQLKPGDVLFQHNNTTKHVALFVGWDDNARTRPIVREEWDDNQVAEQRVWPASWANGFTPMRYKKIVEDGSSGRPRTDHIGDVSGDGYADLTAVRSDGTLQYFANNVNSSPENRPFGNYTKVGEGFGSYTLVRSADVSGDGYADVVGVKNDGTLMYFPNNINSGNGPYGEAINIGSGFQEFTNVILGDVSGDGYADLLATRSDGTLHYFPNNINSNPERKPFLGRTEIGSGFAPFVQLRAGDVSGDGYADLIGVQGDGSLHYLPNNYNSNSDRPFGNAYNVGSGFQIYNRIVLGDVTGDGYADLLATKSNGQLYRYANNINANNGTPYGFGEDIGSGFQIFTTLA